MQLFATVRERAGVADVVIELADGSTSEELWDALVDLYPALAPTRGSTAIARNDEYVGTDVVLEEGDEVALIPPVSGGCGDRFDVTDKPLLIEVLCRQIAGGSAGAIAAFVGVVRDNNDGREVERMEYEANAPMALKVMREIADDARTRWPVDAISVAHRTGVLEVGEASIAIAVSSPHRKEALSACGFIIDRIKEVLPVWKKEVFGDGEAWVEGAEVTPGESIDD